MKIVLAEDRSGKLQGERTFTSDVVRVGRDPAACHYFFTAEQWPMVSRKHAEFRHHFASFTTIPSAALVQ